MCHIFYTVPEQRMVFTFSLFGNGLGGGGVGEDIQKMLFHDLYQSVKFKFQCPYSFKGTQSCPPLQPASGCSHGRRAGLSSRDKRPHAGLTSPQCHTQALQLGTANCRHRGNTTGLRVPYAVAQRFIISRAHPTCQNKARKPERQMLCF